MKLSRVVVPLLVSSSLFGCVSKGKYDEAIAEGKRLHAELDKTRADAAARVVADTNEIGRLNDALKAAEAAMQSRDDKLAELSTGSHNLQAKVDEATAINQQLRGELERLGKNVDKLLTEKGTLSTALDDAKSRLEELRKAQAAAEQRAALFKQLVMKFQKMVDAGELKIALRDGRMVLALPNDVLFDSGKVDIKAAGKTALDQLAKVLATLDHRHFQVAGHTDNVPIQTARFPSNWELSTARAVQVARFLVAQGVKPEALSAAGYGEFDPIAANDTPDGRAKNRRIEITLVPNIDELVQMPVAGK